MFDNRLPADQVAALGVGDVVTFECSVGAFGRNQVRTGKIIRLTPKQVVVHYTSGGRTIEARFRKDDAGQVGAGYGHLLDPAHPLTVESLGRARRDARRQQIDGLAARWSRERDNLDLLRQLHTAIGEYLDAEPVR